MSSKPLTIAGRLAGVAALFLLGVRLSLADIEPVLHDVLARELKFSAEDFVALDRGGVVKHALPPTGPGEVAVVGAVRVNAAVERLVDRVRDIVHFKRGPDVLQIGSFSSPPVLHDLDALSITKDDLDLRDCRVGDCDVRLPADAIARFQREIDWGARDADQRAGALFKQVLLEHVRAYTSGGPALIVQYDDGKRKIRPHEDFLGLLKGSPYVRELAPGLAAHLEHFPWRSLPAAEDLLYWSKEKFGLSSFITVTHVTIAPASSGMRLFVSRDVYSSRYFDASLAVTIAGDTRSEARAFYLVYANRSRANALRGAFSGLRRAIVERRAKSSLEEHLRAVRTRLETGR